MNEMMDGMQGLTSTALIMALVLIGLIVWFFVNRASVRADRQVELLQSLLEEQKRQNVLLKKLIEARGEPEQTVAETADEAENDFIRMIPER